MTISNVASGFILQAAGFAAAQILEEEEAKNVSSLAGRTAVPCLRRSVHPLCSSSSLMMNILGGAVVVGGGGTTIFLLCLPTKFLVDKNSVKYGSIYKHHTPGGYEGMKNRCLWKGPKAQGS
jgi:hypothetical protein